MDFRLTLDQIELRDAVRDYLDGEHGPERLRRLDEQGGRDPAVWDGLVGMGLTGLLVPEEEGGLGLGLVEAALVAIELGRADVSEPIVDSALVAPPFLMPEERAKVAVGELKAALAHPVNPWIADLDQADILLPRQPLPDPVKLGSVDPLRRLFAPSPSTVRPERSRGARPSETEAVSASLDGSVSTSLDTNGENDILDRAALMAAAQLIGASERMLQLATEYAKQREQFGQPIGAFQAVKHLLATVAVKIEFARPLALRAAWTLQEGQPRAPVHISMAKLAAADAATLAAETAIQVHGAMGYTYEVDLHYWMKRTWALAGAWGDRAFHLRRIDDAVIGGGIAIGPDQTFESELARA